MSSWGSGYVTDIAYAAAVHPDQSPRRLALAALICGHEAAIPDRHAPYHFVDIGCGLGLTALIMAATNPGWQVTGIDFNPAHVAAGRRFAEAAGIGNCRFIEADLSRFAGSEAARELGPVDAASLHGLWTWIGPSVREGILDLLATHLKPGGLCHVSYNVLPAWGSMIGLQRLLREAGTRLAARPDLQAERGLAVVKDVVAAADKVADSRAKTILETVTGRPSAYLAHEFMNQHWQPTYQMDVAAELARAKLDHVGSVRLLENFPQLVLDDTLREIASRFEDPAMLELIKDLVAGQALRSEVFIRGTMRMDRARRDAALAAVVVAPLNLYEDRELSFETRAGRASMNEAVYDPVFARLAEGPASLGELATIAFRSGLDDVAELAAMLLGTGQVMPLAEPGAPMDAACVRLNAAMMPTVMAGQGLDHQMALAVPSAGGPLFLPGLAAYAVQRQHGWLSEATLGGALPRPSDQDFLAWAADIAPASSEEDRQGIADSFARIFARRAGLLADLGVPL